MICSDYHVHSAYSSDSEASMESVVEEAVRLGLDRICFTDHMDYDYPPETGYSFVFSLEEYFEQLTALEKKYKGKIQVRKGIELGIMPYLSEKYKKLVNDYPFDFVIASSHLVNGADPYYKEFWEGKCEEDGYRQYFQTIADNIAAYQEFDTYGHIDYIVRYGPNKNKEYAYEKYADLLDEILKGMIQNKKALEVNTSGYKYGLDNAHPQTDVLKRYRELGGERITIGSDAHKPEHLVYDFGRAEEMLKKLGFQHYLVFEQRIPVEVKL